MLYQGILNKSRKAVKEKKVGWDDYICSWMSVYIYLEEDVAREDYC